MFIAAMSMIAKLLKEPRCPSTDEWIKMWCMYNGILLSHKKNEILPFATMQMKLEGITLSETSQSEKDKYHMISLLCGIKKQNKGSWEKGGKNKTR